MYNIINLSARACEIFANNSLSEDYIIISVTEVGYKQSINIANKHIKEVLRLSFDDITDEQAKEWDRVSLGRDCVLFNEDMALLIKDFTNKWVSRGIRNIVVYCGAGISRSGAIVSTLSRYLNSREEYLYMTRAILPNKYVYKVMCKVLGLEYNEERLNRLCDIATKGVLTGEKFYGISNLA